MDELPDNEATVDQLLIAAWERRHHAPAQAQRLAERALEGAQTLLERARALHHRAVCARLLYDLDGAHSSFSEALEIARAHADGALQADCLYGLGAVLSQRQEHVAALEHLGEALDFRRQLDDQPGVTSALIALGLACGALGDYAGALASLREALQLAQRHSDSYNELHALFNIGWVHTLLANHSEGAAYARVCIERARTMGNRVIEARALCNLPGSLLALGEVDEAEQAARGALVIGEEVGDPQTRIGALIALAQVASERNQDEEALALFSQAQELAETYKDDERLADVLCEQAEFSLLRGDTPGARWRFEKVLELAEAKAMPRFLAQAHQGLAAACRRDREWERALGHFEQYHHFHENLQRDSARLLAAALQARMATVGASAPGEGDDPMSGIELAAANAALAKANREKAHLLRQLQKQATHLEQRALEDPLTRLYNRRYLDDFLSRELERTRRYGGEISVAIADLDNFKQVNDRFSHRVGDIVLRTVADVLRAHCRAADVAVRYGGEEFVVVFPSTGLGEATVVCERIRTAIERYDWEAIHPDLRVTASMGIFDGLEGDHQSVLAQADKRLYQAKHAGKNRVVV